MYSVKHLQKRNFWETGLKWLSVPNLIPHNTISYSEDIWMCEPKALKASTYLATFHISTFRCLKANNPL